jgi:ornithine--oxo-acid transaminase
MDFDLEAILRARRGEAYALYEKYLNAQAVSALRFGGLERVYTRGEGAYLYDEAGARYLDFLGGFGVFLLGRSHPTIKKAIAQAVELDLPNLVQLHAEPLAGLLAEKLVARAPHLEKAFFASSGSEAVEAAMKIARGATGRGRFLAVERGFHGMTYGALSVNGVSMFREGFEPLLPGSEFIPFGDLEALTRALATREFAAFIVEPIVGNGLLQAEPSYWEAAAALCKEHGTLLVLDEVQTAGGRTGKFFAFEHLGIKPDMVVLSKALSGGFVPIGALLCRREPFEAMFYGGPVPGMLRHGSTYSKNALSMVAGLATLHAIEEEGLIEKARRTGEILRGRLSEIAARFPAIESVRGEGLYLGLRVRPEIEPTGFVPFLLMTLFQEHRVLAHAGGPPWDWIKLMPPLTIDEAQVNEFGGALSAALTRVTGGA